MRVAGWVLYHGATHTHGERMDKTLASMFTGFALADEGAKQAGLTHTWGVEYDAALAAVATDNGFDTMVADVREVDYSTLATPYWLHTSPPCTTASVANADGGETELDGELSGAVIRALRALRPRRFSLENVIGYRNYDAYRAILAALSDEGYALDWWHLNAADYGVPQTRRRLILVASLDHRPRKPAPTHQEAGEDAGQLTLFDSLPSWRGWLPALRGEYGGRDLLPELPETKLAAWQLKRMPEEWGTMLLNSAFPTSNGKKHYAPDDPAFTVDTTAHGRMKALIIAQGEYGGRDLLPELPESKLANWQLKRLAAAPDKGQAIGPAVFVGGANKSQSFLDFAIENRKTIPGIRNGGEPMSTIPADNATFAAGRAVLIGGANTSDTQAAPGVGCSEAHEPTRAVNSSTSDSWRAVLVPGGNQWAPLRGVVGVRVVKMTPEALARFQSLYDYKLPAKAGLAVKGIGNGVPPWLVKAFVQANL